MSLLENSDKKIQHCELCGQWAYDFHLCTLCKPVVKGGNK